MLQPTVLIPFLLILAALVGFYLWYRNKIKDLTLDPDDRPIAAARLTAERLRNLSSPPWRTVFEIADKHLGPIDHVVVGNPGVFAIETLAMDRPSPDPDAPTGQLTANAAIARGHVDELVARVGVGCKTLVRVYWGTPQPDRPAGVELAPGLVAVEGQRLNDWLVGLPPGPLQPSQVDQAWQTVLTGIGRPDPLG